MKKPMLYRAHEWLADHFTHIQYPKPFRIIPPRETHETREIASSPIGFGQALGILSVGLIALGIGIVAFAFGCLMLASLLGF